MKVTVLYSGGKDSNYALYWALNQGWDVTELLTLKPERDDSYMFHKPCVDLTTLQAESLGLPHRKKTVSGVKEEEVSQLRELLAGRKVDGIVSGAVASEYQKTRLDGVCEELGIRSFAPLWHKRPHTLLEDMLSAGFKIMFVGVYADGLSREWLGRVLDAEALQELQRLSEKHGINVAGEGGEYETLVTFGPTFTREVKVSDYKTVWDGVSGHISVVKASLKN
ncbi:MAG: diphthine--ammonia ligase [Candidatus Altiarchaeota archaeon]